MTAIWRTRYGAKVHDTAGRTSAGGYLTICGREFRSVDVQEVDVRTVPLISHCLSCWGAS